MAAYTLLQQQRIAAGFCVRCGSARTGTGYTRWHCAVCAAAVCASTRARRALLKQTRSPEEAAAIRAKNHDYAVSHRAALKAARRCTQCGRKTTGAEYLSGARLCCACHKKHNASNAEARRQKRLNSPLWAGYQEGAPLPIGGGAARVGTIRKFAVQLDSEAFRALRDLKQRDTEARQKKTSNGKIDIIYQTSRVVRDALRSWADIRECPTRLPIFRTMIETRFHFCADAKTVAAIERHAPARGGNLSATICDLLVATAKRPNYTIKHTALRLSAGGGNVDPWDED